MLCPLGSSTQQSLGQRLVCGVFVSQEGMCHKGTPSREGRGVNARMCPPRASAVAADVLWSPELLRSFESCILELSSAGNRGWAPSHIPQTLDHTGANKEGAPPGILYCSFQQAQGRWAQVWDCTFEKQSMSSSWPGRLWKVWSYFNLAIKYFGRITNDFWPPPKLLKPMDWLGRFGNLNAPFSL